MDGQSSRHKGARVSAGIIAGRAATFCACFLVLQFGLPVAGFGSGSLLLNLVASALMSSAATIVVRLRELVLQNMRMRSAMQHMSQGLCMFDADQQLLICNRRYMQMYDLPDSIGAGCSLRDLLEARVKAGSFSRDIDEYCRELAASLSKGRVNSVEVAAAGGRTVLVTNRPVPGGGWVATHEDITERRAAERERIAMQQQQARSEEHTSELQSPVHLVCRLLLEKKKNRSRPSIISNLTTQPSVTDKFPQRERHRDWQA